MEVELQTETDEPCELELLNDSSEKAIKGEYLEASIHGPRWILGLIDEAI